MTYEYQATVHRIVDGDTVYFKLTKTFTLPIDFGFNIKDTVLLVKDAVICFRLHGINTPEVVGVSKSAGIAATTELTRRLGLGPIRLVSYKADKYGRYLAEVFVTLGNGTELNVNKEMISTGFATPYFGDGPKI